MENTRQEINAVTTNNPLDELTEINGDEMALSEHIEEFSQRLIFCVIALLTATLACFADIRQIV